MGGVLVLHEDGEGEVEEGEGDGVEEGIDPGRGW